MIQNLEDFYTRAKESITEFDAFARTHFPAMPIRADHICYKCESSESFDLLRSLLETDSAFIYQSLISNRRIAIIKFNAGIETTLGPISFLELSDQKPDGSQKEGFDHIEVYPVTISYEEMIATLQKDNDVIHVERPHYVTDDVKLQSGFIFRCCHGPLIEKIKASEIF